MTEELTLLTSTKAPTFSGKQEEWPVFKVMFENHLAQKKLLELLRWEDEVPRDAKVYTAEEEALPETKLEKKVRDQNIYAASILLSSMKTDTKEGMAAWYIVREFINKKDGYSGGHYLHAWKALCDRFEEQDYMAHSELMTAYYNLQMEDTEMPDLFIVKMKQARKRLAEEINIEIKDKPFMLDILSKLPMGTDENVLGPYQQVKPRLKDKICEANSTFMLADLIKELAGTYKSIKKPSEKDIGGSEKAYVGFGKRQFKGRCNKCGKHGHMAKDCRSSGSSSSYNTENRNGGQSGNKTQIECHYCHKKGHKKLDCYKRKKDLANGDSRNGDTANKAQGEIALTALECSACNLYDDSTMLEHDCWRR